MNENLVTKFYVYESSGSGSVTIPKKIAKALGWNHKDEILLELFSKDGNIGIFLEKEGE